MNRKKLAVLAVILLLAAAFLWLDLGRFLTLASLKANRDALVSYYARHPAGAVLAFMLVFIVQTALSLPGATILALGAGAVFGVLKGTLIVNISGTLGATLAFLVSRYLLRDFVLRKFGARLEGINAELDRSGMSYLLFLRLVPLFPFFLINLAAGLTAIPLRTYFLGTMFGIIPGDFVYCNAGASLASINSMKEVASPRVLGAFALLGLFALLPALYRRFRRRKSAATG